jgi:hypothetical protein
MGKNRRDGARPQSFAQFLLQLEAQDRVLRGLVWPFSPDAVAARVVQLRIPRASPQQAATFRLRIAEHQWATWQEQAEAAYGPTWRSVPDLAAGIRRWQEHLAQLEATMLLIASPEPVEAEPIEHPLQQFPVDDFATLLACYNQHRDAGEKQDEALKAVRKLLPKNLRHITNRTLRLYLVTLPNKSFDPDNIG